MFLVEQAHWFYLVSLWLHACMHGFMQCTRGGRYSKCHVQLDCEGVHPSSKESLLGSQLGSRHLYGWLVKLCLTVPARLAAFSWRWNAAEAQPNPFMHHQERCNMLGMQHTCSHLMLQHWPRQVHLGCHRVQALG